MSFSPSFLDELRGRLSLAQVIGRKVKLVKKGREWSGLCPFHNEKSPSFTVNEDKGFYHCFGCGAHGDVITFEMQSRSLSFPEAIERLAAEAGLEIPLQQPEEREKARKVASLHDVTEAAALFFEKELRGPRGHQALDYLKSRGLDESQIARFRLGFAPDSRTALASAFKSAGTPEALAVEAGLLILPEGGGPAYDRFRGRVMFPITDRRGRVIAFGGRIMGEGQPKYLNSPDTPLFHKGSVLYGLAQAREPAAKAGTVIVCEGYMDVIALSSAGLGHAVAPLGTALTESQIELLWRLAPEPVICLDGDAAGRRAAVRAMMRALPLLKPGTSLSFALIPPPEDPDSLIRKAGRPAMDEVLSQAIPLSEMLWQEALASHPTDTPERRALLEKELMERAASIADRSVQEQYRAHLKERLREAFRPARSRPPGAFVPNNRSWRGRPEQSGLPRGQDGRLLGLGRPPPPASARDMQERLLILTVITHPGLLDELGERLGMVGFADMNLDKLRQEVLKQPQDWVRLDFPAAERHLRSRGLSQIMDSLLDSKPWTPSPLKWAFVSPDSSADDARSGWEHIFKLYTEKDREADMQGAEARLAAELTEENLGPLRALKASDGAKGE